MPRNPANFVMTGCQFSGLSKMLLSSTRNNHVLQSVVIVGNCLIPGRERKEEQKEEEEEKEDEEEEGEENGKMKETHKY